MNYDNYTPLFTENISFSTLIFLSKLSKMAYFFQGYCITKNYWPAILLHFPATNIFKFLPYIGSVNVYIN